MGGGGPVMPTNRFTLSNAFASKLKENPSRSTTVARVGAEHLYNTNPPYSQVRISPYSLMNYQQQVMISEPLGYWIMDDANATMEDDSGSAYHGEHFNSPTPVDGSVNLETRDALSYNGTNQYSTVPNPSLTTNCTIEAIIYWTSGTKSVLRDASTGGNGWIFAQDSGGFLAFRVGGTDFVTTVATASVQNDWKHLVLVKSGGSVEYFVDGVSSYTGSGAPSTASTPPWYVAKDGLDANYVAIRMQHLSMYSEGLPDDEVLKHYNAYAGVEVIQ